MFNLSANGVLLRLGTLWMDAIMMSVCKEPFCVSSVCFHAVQSAPELKHWRNSSCVYYAVLRFESKNRRVSRCFWALRIFVLLCKRPQLGRTFHLISFNQQQLGLLMRPWVRCIKTLVYPAFLPFWFFWSSIFLHFVFFALLFHRLWHTDAHTLRQLCLSSLTAPPAPAPCCRFSILLNLDSFRLVPNKIPGAGSQTHESPPLTTTTSRMISLDTRDELQLLLPQGGIPGDWWACRLSPTYPNGLRRQSNSNCCSAMHGRLNRISRSWQTVCQISTRGYQWFHWPWATPSLSQP